MSNIKEVAKLSEFSGNGNHRGAIDAVNDHKQELEDGRLKGFEKVMIISLDDTDGNYSVKWSQAGLKSSEMLSLLEVAKTTLLGTMGYLDA